MKKMTSKYAAWYGNGMPVNINPSRWEKDKGLSGRSTGIKTEEEVKEDWGKSSENSDRKKHKIRCQCDGTQKCDGSCKCQN